MLPTVTFIHSNGDRTKVEAPEGVSVMRAASDGLVKGIVGECGGDLSCATCHVFVEPEWFDRLEPAGDDEAAMLEATSEEPTERSRLSCQIFCSDALDGLVVRIPESQQ